MAWDYTGAHSMVMICPEDLENHWPGAGSPMDLMAWDASQGPGRHNYNLPGEGFRPGRSSEHRYGLHRRPEDTWVWRWEQRATDRWDTGPIIIACERVFVKWHCTMVFPEILEYYH